MDVQSFSCDFLIDFYLPFPTNLANLSKLLVLVVLLDLYLAMLACSDIAAMSLMSTTGLQPIRRPAL